MVQLSLFAPKYKPAHPREYKDATLSDFGGGLNVIDNDTTLKSRFAKVLRNWNKNVDGSMSVRWGTRLKFRVDAAVTGNIIELIYFNGYLLAVTSTGQICRIDSAGVITVIWNATIAAALVGAPAGWSTGLTLGSIDYSEFKGELIIVNGVDKPLIVKKTMAVQYLSDPASGSNIHVPASKYVTTVGNYLVMAGVPAAPSDIYISNQATSGVWVGDAAPNDAVVISIGSYVPQNSGDILGIGSFRNYLLVAFEGAIVVVELGAYDTGTATPIHKPKVQDNIVEHGVISHRSTVTLKNDFVMADILGWHSAVRNQFGRVDTKSLSRNIDPEFIKDVPTTPTDRIKCFSVRNPLESRIMTYVYNATAPVVYNMTSDNPESVKSQAWNTYDGWDWDCGVHSGRGRVFFSKGTKIFQYGNAIYLGEGYTADLLGNYDAAWITAQAYVVGYKVLQDGKSYTCLVAHVSGVFATDLAAADWVEYLGEDISFDWELPWSDINSRARKKFLKLFQADTTGKAQFNISIFFDNYYKDLNGAYDPALTLDFDAGNSGGYGAGDQPYGGGRRLKDERPWQMPGEFKLMKLRFHGASKQALSMITFTIFYWIGTFRR